MSNEESSEIPESGAVYTFGKSRFAENIPSHFFVRKDPIIDLSCGDEHTVVICRNGRAFSFGRNSWGELGLSHRMAVGKPNCIKSLKPRKSINVACGRAHTLILTDSGQVFSCGNNDDGQLGLQDILSRDSPQEITTLSDIKQVSAGSNHSAALSVGGQVFTWGSNKEGQLGLGIDAPFINIPTQLVLDCKIVQIACGYYHTLLLSDEGKVLAFGEGEYGKLGIGDEIRRNEPALVNSFDSVQYVAAGGNHSAAITLKGKLFLWGCNDHGQLGLNIKDFLNQPMLFAALEEAIITQVSCGENHTAIVTGSGLLFTFGDNNHGKLCFDKNDDQIIGQSTCPIKIKKFENFQVIKVSCGGCHTMVLAAPRTICTSNPLLKNTVQKDILLEGKFNDNDTDSLYSSKLSTKTILPPLQRPNRAPSTIPSPTATPIDPSNIATMNTFPTEIPVNDPMNSPPKTPETICNSEVKTPQCEESNVDKNENNTSNDEHQPTTPVKKASSFYHLDNKVSLHKSSKSCGTVSEDSLDVQIKCLDYITHNTTLDVLNNNSYEIIANNKSNDSLLNETSNMKKDIHSFQSDNFESWYKKQKKDMELVSEQIHKAKINLKRMLERYEHFANTSDSITEFSCDDSQDICCSYTNYRKWSPYYSAFHSNNVCNPTEQNKSEIYEINHNYSRNVSDSNSYYESKQTNSYKEVIGDKKNHYLCGKEYWGNTAWEDPGAAGDGPQVVRFQRYQLENRAEEEIISGKCKGKTESSEYLEMNGAFKQDHSSEENKLLTKYLKIKEKTQAQNIEHNTNKGSLKYSERKSKMCTIL